MRFSQYLCVGLTSFILASCGNTKSVTEVVEPAAKEPTIEELMAGVPEGASRVADQKPYWPHCLDEAPENPYSCTSRDIYAHLANNAKRPEGSDRGGSLILDYDINEVGVVDWALVIRGINPAVDQAAIDLVMSLPPFMPALRDSLPIRYRQTVKVEIP